MKPCVQQSSTAALALLLAFSLFTFHFSLLADPPTTTQAPVTSTAGTAGYARASGTANAVGGNTYFTSKIPGMLNTTDSDDWATFQAVLNTATSAGFVVINQEHDFWVSQSVRVLSNTIWHGNGFAVRALGGINMPVMTTVLSGATISTSNVWIDGVTFDANGADQNEWAESTSAWNLQGDLTWWSGSDAGLGWTMGTWVGSATGMHFTDVVFLNGSSFTFVMSNLHHSSFEGCSFINNDDDDSPPFGGHNHDSVHLWGPCDDVIFHHCYATGGDDDWFGFLPVEDTPEAGDTSGHYSTRRGHGGPITNIDLIDDTADNVQNGIRFGGFSVTTGTAQWEDFIDNINISISGTTYNPMQTMNTNIGRVNFIRDCVRSGTAGGNAITLMNGGAPDAEEYTLDGIAADVPVYWTAGNNGVGLDNVSLGGAYAAELHGLRDGCMAFWSGTNDLTGNGFNLSSSNGVTFTSGTLCANCPTFTASSHQELLISSTTLNVTSYPAWTIAGWFNSGNTGNYAYMLSMGSASTVAGNGFIISPSGASYNGGYGCAPLGADFTTVFSPAYFGLGHWNFICARQRASDGKQSWINSTPCNSLCAGAWGSGWVIPPVTGATFLIEIGGSARQGAWTTGQTGPLGIWKRCLTDREVQLLCNQGTDGNAKISPPIYAPRIWPFNH